MSFFMYARKRLDISYRDLAFSAFALFSKNDSETRRQIATLWKGTNPVTTLSVRTALDLYLQALNLPRGSEVIMSGMTIDDMVTIVAHHGLIPVALDLDPEKLTATPQELDRLITKKTKAVIFAHLWGAIAPIDDLISLCHRRHLLFIEDCAQAFVGSSYFGNPRADISLFSFGMIKTATALGGGIATVQNASIANHMRQREASYPLMKSSWFFMRLQKILVLKLLSAPFWYGLFVFVCRITRIDYDNRISHSTHGFATQELIEQIRHRPPVALLSLLHRRIKHYHDERVALRTYVGWTISQQLPASLSVMGEKASRHSFWVFPVLSDRPQQLTSFLQQNGFDATLAGTSMHLVEPKTTPRLASAKNQLVYLPVYPELPEREGLRLLRLLHDFETRSASFEQATDMFSVHHAFSVTKIRPSSIEELRSVIISAQKNGTRVSIAGTNRNLGGHSFSSQGIQIDMSLLRGILSLDLANNLLTVQAGALWHHIQEYLHPYQKTLLTMQSSSWFSVGGSIGSNIHGRDIHHSSMIQSVESLRVMLADGSLVKASRKERPDLFFGICGGYGLLGIVVDCTLRITDNVVYLRKTECIPMHAFIDYWNQRIFPDQSLRMFISEPSSAPSAFLRQTIISTWHDTGTLADINLPLGNERHILRDRFFLHFARVSFLGREICWHIERVLAFMVNKTRISRTNSMRPPTVGTKFLERNSPNYVDIVQEVFVPIRTYETFLKSLKPLLTNPRLRILDVSTRFVQKDSESLLSYASRENMFSVMIFQSRKLGYTHAFVVAQTISKIIETAMQCGGTYYITDQEPYVFPYLKKAYPQLDQFLELKKKTDPSGIFQSLFYQRLMKYRALQTPLERE